MPAHRQLHLEQRDFRVITHTRFNVQLVEYANSLNDSGSVAEILGRAMQIKQQLIYCDLGCAKVRFEDKLKQKFIMGASDKYFSAVGDTASLCK